MRLTAQESRDRFAAARVARLATTGADGRPHLVPVTFALVERAVVIAVDHKPKSTTRLRRLQNIAQRPGVALLVDHYAEEWTALWWVRADAAATVIPAEAPSWAPAIDALVAKYEQYHAVRPAGPVIRAEVLRWSGWSAAGP